REATDRGANVSRSRSIVRRPGHRSVSCAPMSCTPVTQAVRGSPSRASRGATSGSPANCELAVTVTRPTAVGGSVPHWRGPARGGGGRVGGGGGGQGGGGHHVPRRPGDPEPAVQAERLLAGAGQLRVAVQPVGAAHAGRPGLLAAAERERRAGRHRGGRHR